MLLWKCTVWLFETKKMRAECNILVLHSVHSLDSMVNMIFFVLPMPLYGSPLLTTPFPFGGRGRGEEEGHTLH